ncbi:MAG: hypothetical protein F6K41_36115 [Symploca sp. SIO3E6]|nr:hypothetical protein [Caldora sp. SIO3E6]
MMKKTLRIFACLLIALTVTLMLNVSNASAQPAACDKSTTPTCRTELYPGDCQRVPLPGYTLEQIEISFPEDGIVPQIFPPPVVVYNVDLCDNQVEEGQLSLTTKNTYNFNPPQECPGVICNPENPDVYRFNMPFTLTWKNTP